ncbi:MAG: AAA family ATPase [Minisyncoccia bacterium]
MTQKQALEILKMGYNCYITGAAGSGKTHLLNEYINFLKNKGVEVGVTASTGIAATHIGGSTIHSWSGIGIKDDLTLYDLEDLESKKYIYDRLKNTDVLVIDEISMLHHSRLDLVDNVARRLRRVNAPFGGMQVILCGDFFQLPPVSRMGERESHFSYKSSAWKDLNMRICYLDEQHRQKDQNFLKVLNDIRGNCVSEDTLLILRERYNKKTIQNIEPTRLHTHNINVDSINEAELAKISGQTFVFNMEEKGRKPLLDSLKKSCLAPEILKLKIGAKVIFVKNNAEAGYANGTLGKIIDCKYGHPRVMTVSGKVIDVEVATWKIEEEGKTKAVIEQFPIRLAWAITVHKSQGMSLDAVEVDLSRSFEKGMGYVALSRVRSLEGLNLLGMNDMALCVNDEVLEYDEMFRKRSEIDVKFLESLDESEIKEKQAKFLEKISPIAGSIKIKKRKVSASDKVKAMIEGGLSIKEIAKLKNVKVDSVISNIEKILAKDSDFDISKLKAEVPNAKFTKIYSTFKDLYGDNRDFLLSPIKNKLGADYSFEEIRIVRLFVRKIMS